MYADDSTLYHAAKTVSELANVLSAELSMVFDWIKQNKLVLNEHLENQINCLAI